MKKPFVLALAVLFILSTAATVMAAPVDFSGNIRLRYNVWDYENGPTDDNGTYRVGLNFSTQASDSVNLFGRFGKKYAWGADNSAGDPTFDRFGIKYTVGKDTTLTIGRQDAWLGQGLIIDTTGNYGEEPSYDGFLVSTKFDRLTLNVTSGMLTQVGGFDETDPDTGSISIGNSTDNGNFTGADIAYPVTDKVTLGVAYGKFDISNNNNSLAVTAFNVSADITDKLNITGEYAKSDADDQNKAWYIWAAYKISPKLTFNTTYREVEPNAVDQIYSTYMTDFYMGAGKEKAPEIWLDYKLDQANTLTLYYSDMKPETGDKQTLTRLQLITKF